MEYQARLTAFHADLDQYRRHAKRPGPEEIVTSALRHGLKPRDALSFLYEQFTYSSRSAALNIPLEFFGEFARSAGITAVLELSGIPCLLSTLIGEQVGKSVTVACRERSFAEILTKLFPYNMTCVDDVAGIGSNERFDLIVFQEFHGVGRVRKNCQMIANDLFPRLSAKGTVFWLTGSAVATTPQGRNALAQSGLYIQAIIDVPSSIFGSSIAGCMIVFSREPTPKRLVASLRDEVTAKEIAKTLATHSTKKNGPAWEWLDPADGRTFSMLEAERQLRSLLPRGRFEMMPLRELVTTEQMVKADRMPDGDIVPGTALYVPEYAGSKVTTRLEDQSVKPRAVYVLQIDVTKSSPRFLAFILNSAFGKGLRWNAAQGATIQRLAFEDLLSLKVPVPAVSVQDELTSAESDISLLQAMLGEMRDGLRREWKSLPAVSEKIAEIKSTIDLEKKIEKWNAELPYPLATIYRRYCIETDPRDRFETLLHFFEVAAIFVATLSTSYVRVLRTDWESVLGGWMHPATGNSIERADFGFWSNLASTSLKELRRILSDSELRSAAIANAGAEVLAAVELITLLSPGFSAIDTARDFRNSKAHGGLLKANDAERLESELKKQLREYYEIASPVFRRVWLIKPGKAEYGAAGFTYEFQKLVSSDPLFSNESAVFTRPIESGALAFWLSGSQTAVKALPFLRLGKPRETSETSLYVFNRVDKKRFRWVSYQEAREQEIFVEDQELESLLSLRVTVS